jgi:hypothetical protein
MFFRDKMIRFLGTLMYRVSRTMLGSGKLVLIERTKELFFSIISALPRYIRIIAFLALVMVIGSKL